MPCNTTKIGESVHLMACNTLLFSKKALSYNRFRRYKLSGDNIGNKHRYERYIKQKIEMALIDTPVVMIADPRQCGIKTIAAENFYEGDTIGDTTA